ncbi:MAG: CBS domain-containing protein [Cyclobacteriaceae bacterium]
MKSDIMGDFKVKKLEDTNRASFIYHLLRDIEALEFMIENKHFEQGVVRMGAEQEFCLTNLDFSPSIRAVEILEEINDPHFTTELARYNLELNLDPVEVTGNCFSETRQQLKDFLARATQAANRYDTKIILAGILPTIRKKELSLEYLTPYERYYHLNEIMRDLRGSDFSLHLRGVDELTVLHDSILFEACNTSFQLHLQVSPDDMVASYNWAQAIAGPVLSVCANSPMLLGRELWSETRIALFQQSVDTRKASYSLTDQEPRVAFGKEWLRDSIVDIFKDDIARHRIILSGEIVDDSLALAHDGEIPSLRALRIHNGTIYRWNRPCYGVLDGKPHLRIENRYIPSGPSVEDEIANFAFWIGLMLGRPKRFDDLNTEMNFIDVKENFYKAARTGKETQLKWLGKSMSASDLVRHELLPVAYDGLRKAKVAEEDITHFLQIIELRTNRNTGASWTVESYRHLKEKLKKDDALKALTDELYSRQLSDKPVHEWEVVTKPPPRYPVYENKLVHEIMSSQIFTVHPNDLSALVVHIMNWKNIHHVPVVDRQDQLVGILTSKNTIPLGKSGSDALKEVKDIMVEEVITAEPFMTADDAAQIMLEKKIGCMPVVDNGKLLGIITRNDIVTLNG